MTEVFKIPNSIGGMKLPTGIRVLFNNANLAHFVLFGTGGIEDKIILRVFDKSETEDLYEYLLCLGGEEA